MYTGRAGYKNGGTFRGVRYMGRKAGILKRAGYADGGQVHGHWEPAQEGGYTGRVQVSSKGPRTMIKGREGVAWSSSQRT